MRHYVLVVAIIAALLSGVTAAAHPGHDHKVMGSIVAIDGRHVTLRTTDGKEITFEVTATTKLVRAKEPGAFADLKAGMRVVANVGDGEEPLKAKEVEYAAEPSTAGHVR
jgi:hypothetical protein